MSKVSVKNGQWIRMGDYIGILGSTGDSTAPHTHLGLRRCDSIGNVLDRNNGWNGYIDPEPFLVFWKSKGLGM